MFVGVEAGFLYNKTSDEIKDEVLALGIKAGYRFTLNHRVYGVYNYVTKSKDTYWSAARLLNSQGQLDATARADAKYETTVHKFLVGYDFTLEISEKVRAVVGVYGGIARINLDADIIGTGGTARLMSVSDSANDFIYGGKLGGIYEIGSGEIEVTFKVYRASYKFDGGDLDSTNYGVYLGYNYKF